jgi:hypothetical protein
MCANTDNENTIKECLLTFVADSIARYERLKTLIDMSNVDILGFMFSETETEMHKKYNRVKKILDEYKEHIEKLQWLHTKTMETM